MLLLSDDKSQHKGHDHPTMQVVQLRKHSPAWDQAVAYEELKETDRDVGGQFMQGVTC